MKRCLCATASKALLISLSCMLTACDANDKKQEPKAETTKAVNATKPVETTKAPSMESKERTFASGLKVTRMPNSKQVTESDQNPSRGQRVTVHYTGWLSDGGKRGMKFDSSVDRGQEFTFTIGVGQVIKGWDEGVMTMKVGETCEIFIPSAMGYGSRGAGAKIPPNADLIFEVQLIKVA